MCANSVPINTVSMFAAVEKMISIIRFDVVNGVFPFHLCKSKFLLHLSAVISGYLLDL